MATTAAAATTVSENTTTTTNNNNNNTAALTTVVKTVSSYIPYSTQILDITTSVYNNNAPVFVKDVVENQVKPLANIYCERVLLPAAAFPTTAYTYAVKITNVTIDVVLPPVSKEAKEEALETLFAVPSKVSGRVVDRTAALNADVKAVLTAFADKVTNAKRNDSAEASVFRLAHDVLLVLQTTPLATPLAQVSTTLPLLALPHVDLPSDQFSTKDALEELVKDSHALAKAVANSLLERYNISRSQVLQLVQDQVAAITAVVSPASAPSAPSAPAAASESH